MLVRCFFWIVYEFSFVFGWIYGKMDEIIKIWANYRVLCRGVGIPTSSVGPRHRVAKMEDLASLGYAEA